MEMSVIIFLAHQLFFLRAPWKAISLDLSNSVFHGHLKLHMHAPDIYWLITNLRLLPYVLLELQGLETSERQRPDS